MKIYQSEEDGTIYWLDDGVLMFAPMLAKGGVIESHRDGGEVDWQNIDQEDVPRLREIERELNAVEDEGWSECNHYATDEFGLCVRCGYNTLHLTNKELKERGFKV